jgi:transposase-like protein
MAERKRMTAEEVVGYLLEGEGLDFLKESLLWVVQQLMEAEVSELIGAERGERAPAERLTHRNGYRSRAWSTRAGELELAIPKLRRGSYFPSFLEPRRRSEQALVSVVQEAYVAGVSTRKVDQVVESLGLRISKSEVSRISRASTSRWRPSATARSRAATRTCGSTPRSRRCATRAASSGRHSCSPTACTSPATGR